MKYFKICSILLAALVAFTTCKDAKVGPVVKDKPGAPKITSPKSNANFEIDRNQTGDTLLTIKWSKPDFGFASAPAYNVELKYSQGDSTNIIPLGTFQQTSVSFTAGDLNTTLLKAGLQPGQAQKIDISVKAVIGDSLKESVAKPVAISVTPFQADFPPIYMIGAAVGGWDPAKAVTVPSTDPNVYSNLAEFQKDEAFRFFAQKDFNPTSYNYPYFSGGRVDPMLVNANDGDSNFKFTGSTGWYKVTANLKTKTVKMKAVDEPIMYMTGAGIGGWDKPGTGASVKMDFVQEGVFEATTKFDASGDANFRFFAQADWGPDSYNYPYFSDNNGTIGELLVNAQDDDSNFKFVGTTGMHYIKVDFNNYIVEMEPAN